MEKKIKGVFTRDNTYTLLQYVQELENKIKLLNDSVNSLSDKVGELNTNVSELPPVDTIVTTDKPSIFTNDAYLDIHAVHTIQLTDNMSTPGLVELGIINEYDNSYNEIPLNGFLNPLLHMRTSTYKDIPQVIIDADLEIGENISCLGSCFFNEVFAATLSVNNDFFKITYGEYGELSIGKEGSSIYMLFESDGSVTLKNNFHEYSGDFDWIIQYINWVGDNKDKVTTFMNIFYEGATSEMRFENSDNSTKFIADCDIVLNSSTFLYGNIYLSPYIYIDDTKINSNYITKLNTNNLGEDENGERCFGIVDKNETTLTPSYTNDNFSIRYLSFGCRDQSTWDNGNPLLNIDADYSEPNLNGIEFEVNNINPDNSYFRLSTSFTSTINRVCGRLLVFNGGNTLDKAFDLFLVKDGDACKLKLFDSSDPTATSYTFPTAPRLVFTLSEMETWRY